MYAVFQDDNQITPYTPDMSIAQQEALQWSHTLTNLSIKPDAKPYKSAGFVHFGDNVIPIFKHKVKR